VAVRVVIVTGTKPHHKSLCAEIGKAFDLVGIIHPADKSGGYTHGRRLLRAAKRHGWPLAFLHMLGRIAPSHALWIDASPVASVDRLSKGVADYGRIPRSLIHDAQNVRDPATTAVLRSLRADVIVCLGGPVYPASFIQAAPLVLNYHSGISPLYNGTSSIAFAFANGHPHLCGGTLMRMSTTIDGGNVLAHYLPSIEPGDTPSSLFEKTVTAAPRVYSRILEALANGGTDLPCVRQPPPLFSTLAIHFGWYQTAKITQYVRTDLAARFRRNESILEYWAERDEEAATAAFRSALGGLLWQRPLAGCPACA